jgi:predicted ATPase
MARFLALLVNNGAHVLITTHSDYIIDEINNCIKLFNMKEADRNYYLEKYGLKEYPDIAISQDKVGVCLFREKDDEIEVKPLEIDKYGIIDENFKEVSEELFERSIELGEKVE